MAGFYIHWVSRRLPIVPNQSNLASVKPAVSKWGPSLFLRLTFKVHLLYLLVSLSCHKVPQAGASTPEAYFSQLWRMESVVKVPADLVPGEGPLPSVPTCVFLVCMGTEAESPLWHLPCEDTNPLGSGTHPYDSFNLITSSEAPPPDPSTRG